MRRLALLLIILPLAACSFGGKSVDKDEVAQQISKKLGAQIGREPEKVTCPKDLKGEEGKTLRCTLTDSGKSYGVTVKVTDVEGKKIKFNIKVDQQPK